MAFLFAALCIKRISMDIHEFARLGGKARMRNLNQQARTELARKAVRARWAKRKPKTAIQD